MAAAHCAAKARRRMLQQNGGAINPIFMGYANATFGLLKESLPVIYPTGRMRAATGADNLRHSLLNFGRVPSISMRLPFLLSRVGSTLRS